MKKRATAYQPNGEWRDFGLKINYIYEVLFQKDKEKLINYLSKQNGLSNRHSRRKTIDNWLKGEIKKPHGFNLSNFKISEYKYPNGELLFNRDSFQLWSIERFRNRVDDYIEVRDSLQKQGTRLKYIYYYNINERSVDHYHITYPDPQNPSYVHLKSSLLTNEMTYKGELFEYQNMLYLFARNDFDHMTYIVDNSANIFLEDVKVYGTGQCKDYATRQPKVYLALFSSNQLTAQELEKYQHKLNESNLLIATGFPKNCNLAEDYLFHNFYEKLHTIGDDLFAHYENTHVNNRDYHNIIIKEFKAYLHVLKKSAQHFDFFISTQRKLKTYSLEFFLEENQQERGVIILYTLTPASIPFFLKIINYQEEFIDLQRIHLRYLLVIEDRKLLNNQLLKQLQRLERRGVTIQLLKENPSIYSEFFITIDTNFALYRMGEGIEDKTFVTKHYNTINQLYETYERINQESTTLHAFLEESCQLNGKWFCYSYSSKADNSYYHTVPIKIQNNQLIAQYSTGCSLGTVYKNKNQTLLILEDSLIKIYNQNLQDDIFKVSIIGKELYIELRDLLVYGIMSREPLKPQEVHLLLDAIHIKDDHDFRLKTSDSFDSTLAEFKAKRNQDILPTLPQNP